jgi:hypothetical protein
MKKLILLFSLFSHTAYGLGLGVGANATGMGMSIYTEMSDKTALQAGIGLVGSYVLVDYVARKEINQDMDFYIGGGLKIRPDQPSDDLRIPVGILIHKDNQPINLGIEFTPSIILNSGLVYPDIGINVRYLID